MKKENQRHPAKTKNGTNVYTTLIFSIVYFDS